MRSLLLPVSPKCTPRECLPDTAATRRNAVRCLSAVQGNARVPVYLPLCSGSSPRRGGVLLVAVAPQACRMRGSGAARRPREEPNTRLKCQVTSARPGDSDPYSQVPPCHCRLVTTHRTHPLSFLEANVFGYSKYHFQPLKQSCSMGFFHTHTHKMTHQEHFACKRQEIGFKTFLKEQTIMKYAYLPLKSNYTCDLSDHRNGPQVFVRVLDANTGPWRRSPSGEMLVSKQTVADSDILWMKQPRLSRK